jgi:hypothetical protein
MLNFCYQSAGASTCVTSKQITAMQYQIRVTSKQITAMQNQITVYSLCHEMATQKGCLLFTVFCFLLSI